MHSAPAEIDVGPGGMWKLGSVDVRRFMMRLQAGSFGVTRPCVTRRAYASSGLAKTSPPFAASGVWHVPVPLAQVGTNSFV